ncbi:hypothetical protein GT3570_02885 [Geobacillus thermoleovorans]|uniref:hypothetical protein n=1 Tax=Geobacillus thermoleovorans TaxID=33941 RepID=UPI00078D1E41|nr:hypothetical protein GT3570_02885 [Geobacillus thermoleovorans]MED4876611.1 hypothetical protein [Anoxybacillus geothermalis]
MVTTKEINKVKELFKEAIRTGEFKSKFDLIFGNNGVILRPKAQELKSLCVKSQLVKALSDLKPNEQKPKLPKEQDELFNEVFSKKGVLTYSISRDIEIYEEIQKHKELIEYVPQFYFSETHEEPNFIIMDFIEGEYIERMLLTDGDRDLLDIYGLFREKGFEIIDRLEAIYNRKKNHYTIIDLGSFCKISS